MLDLMHDNMWALWLCLVIAPFVQEDAALLAAAGLAASGTAAPAPVFVVFLAALVVSDVWKYALGRAAHQLPWARRLAERPAARRAQQLLIDRLGRTILTVRFIPGARVATYIAAGYVRAPFPRFAAWVVVSAALLCALTFGAFLILGAALGERLRAWLPAVAIAIAGALLLAAWARQRLRR